MLDRREILGAATGALGVSLTGCVGALPWQASSVPFEVPSPEECTRTDRPMPDPVAGYEPRPYPDPPEDFDETAAGEFALAHERAIRYNELLAENISEETDEFHVGISSGPTTQAGNGHLVGLDVSAYTEEDGAVVDWRFAVIYYIAPRVGLRASPDSEDIYNVSLRECNCTVLGTVYCQ